MNNIKLFVSVINTLELREWLADNFLAHQADMLKDCFCASSPKPKLTLYCIATNPNWNYSDSITRKHYYAKKYYNQYDPSSIKQFYLDIESYHLRLQAQVRRWVDEGKAFIVTETS